MSYIEAADESIADVGQFHDAFMARADVRRGLATFTPKYDAHCWPLTFAGAR